MLLTRLTPNKTEIMNTSIQPALKVMIFFLLITSILIVIARGATKAVIVRSINRSLLDDYLISLSLVSIIRHPHSQSRLRHTAYTQPQSSCSALDNQWPFTSKSWMATESHRGSWAWHRCPLNSKFVPGYPSSKYAPSDRVQSEYAAGLLYILSLVFTKLAVLTLLKSITPLHWEQRAAYSLAALVILWATTGVFAAAFMCHVPNTWDWPNGQCNDRVQSALSCYISLYWLETSMLSGTTSRLLTCLPILRLLSYRWSWSGGYGPRWQEKLPSSLSLPFASCKSSCSGR